MLTIASVASSPTTRPAAWSLVLPGTDPVQKVTIIPRRALGGPIGFQKRTSTT